MERTWTHWATDEDVKIIDALRDAYNHGNGIVNTGMLNLPGRTRKAIKQRTVYLRKQLGYEQVNRTALIERNRQFSRNFQKKTSTNGSFASALSEFMESWVAKQQNGNVSEAVKKAVAEKDEEIAQLKEMLRELKTIREAVEKYQRRD